MLKKLTNSFLNTALFCGVLMAPPLLHATTLEDALQIALENNPKLSSDRAKYMAFRQNQIVAFSASLPQVTAYARSSTNDTTTVNDFTGEEKFGWPAS